MLLPSLSWSIAMKQKSAKTLCSQLWCWFPSFFLKPNILSEVAKLCLAPNDYRTIWGQVAGEASPAAFNHKNWKIKTHSPLSAWGLGVNGTGRQHPQLHPGTGREDRKWKDVWYKKKKIGGSRCGKLSTKTERKRRCAPLYLLWLISITTAAFKSA